MQRRSVFAVIAATALFFVACSSSPKFTEVSPVELLGEGETAYLLIPVPQNRAFTEKAISFLSGDGDISQKDVSRLLSRLETVALSVFSQNSDFAWTLCASGNFPTTLSKLVLTEKNGWYKRDFENLRYYQSEEMAISMMTDSAACASSKTANAESTLSRWLSIQKGESAKGASDEIKSFLESDGDGGNIRFFVPNATTFFESFIGIPLGVKSVRGILTQVQNEELFDSEFEIEFSNPFAALAFSAVVRRVDGVSVSEGENGRTILRGLRVSWQQILLAVSQ